jgi:RimJ/RimL family protein N-acetyltransferase
MSAVRTLADLPWPWSTERLSIRRAVVDDAAAVHAYARLPECAEWVMFPNDDAAEFAERFVRRLPWQLVAELDGRVVADLRLELVSPWAQADVAAQVAGSLAEVAWTVDPALWGRGLGTECAEALLVLAFEGLGVRRVRAAAFADNRASVRVMEKVGLRQEGRFVRDSFHRRLGWIDGVEHGLLAEEWRDRRGL